MGFVEAPGTAVHVTVADALPSVLEHGLRPAAYWIEKAVGLSDDERGRLLERPRAQVHRLEQPDGRVVWLRDQQPLLRRPLEASLVEGVTVAQFVRQVNSYVFLFPSEAMARSLIALYREVGDQVLLRFDTARLLQALRDDVALTIHNTGAIGQGTTRRYKGPGQFVRLTDWSGGHPGEIAVGRAGIPPDVLRDSLVGTDHIFGAGSRG